MNAHPYDEIENPNNLSLKDIGNALKEIELYLGYISTFSNTGVALNSLSHSIESDYEDIVDMIICGAIDQIPFNKNPWGDDLKLINYEIAPDRRRKLFYEELHSIHEQNNQPSLLFNDKRKNGCHVYYYQFSDLHKHLFNKSSTF